MSKNLIKLSPATRINDLFVTENTTLDFSTVADPYKDPLIQGNPNIDNRVAADFYKKIGIDIVVETAMEYPYNFITEKTYRPIANGRPFVIIGPLHSLSFLKSLGFLTFSSIIDESYDNIKDPEKRFITACNSIRAFVNQPINTVVDNLQSIETILIKNQQHFKNLKNNQLALFKEKLQIDSD
jgi:hypothetical protein